MTTFIWILTCFVCFIIGGVCGSALMYWITAPQEEIDDEGNMI